MPAARREPVRRTTHQGTPCLQLSGTVGIAQARRLLEAAFEAREGQGRVTVDCQNAEHLDTSALQVLVALKAALARDGRELAIQGLSDGVAHYLALSGLDRELRGAATSTDGQDPRHDASGGGKDP